MIEEGDLVWTLMISYYIQKETDDNRMTSNNGEKIGDIHDLARSDILLALQSERE